MAQRQCPLVFDFLHDTLHERRFTLAVLPDKGNLVPAFHRQVCVAEHHVIAIRFADTFHNHRITSRTGRRRKFQPQSGSIFLIYLQQFQLFQHLDTALHLQRLRIRSFEAFDELFRLSDKFLLLVISLLLLFAAFFAQGQILGVIHFIIVDTSHCHFNSAGGDVVHKLAVVADDNHRFAVVDQKIFEPLDRFDVEVVRRLVEQEHVRFLQQQLCQLDAHPPAAAEIARLPLEILAGEPEAEQRLFHIFLVVGGIDRIELLA